MRTFRVLALALCIALIPSTAAAADCQFVLGFKTLRDLIGQGIVGECLENQHHGANGDALQQTTGGLLVWRKADNWTAFTDGYRTWINGPNGLVQRLNTERFAWEADYAPGGITTRTPTPSPSPTPTPTAIPVLIPARSLTELATDSAWYRDGVDCDDKYFAECRALWALEEIDRNNPQLAGVMSSWAWIFDEDMDVYEVSIVEYIAELDEKAPEFVPYLVKLPWIHDSIDPWETSVASNLYIVALRGELSFALELATAPWVVDGLDASEQQVIGMIRELVEQGSQQLIPVLAQMSWMQDGPTATEASVLRGLVNISSGERQGDAVVLDILKMPFLNGTIDAVDAATVSSLSLLHDGPDRSYLREVLSHPTLRGGITDSQRVRLTFLPLTVSSDPSKGFPEVFTALLDPSKATVEERIIFLPLAGPIRLAVAHTRRGKFHTMGYLERVMRLQEEFMLEPFPLKYVGVLTAEITPAASGASFAGGMIAIDPGGENAIHLIAHEVAHKYWTGVSPWLAEGGAEVLRVVSVGDPLRIENVELSLCRLADNLSEIDRIESKPKPDAGVDVFPYVTVECPYVIGLGLFADLYENLGNMAFRQGFRRLYAKARDGAHEDMCFDAKRAVCLVKEAFVIDAPTPRAAAIAEPIIDFWYNGSRAEIRRRGR